MALSIVLAFSSFVYAQEATVTETTMVFRTYPFSDPDPVPRMGNIYPYFRYQGYAMQGVERPWKVIRLENPHITVLIAPEVGGKVLGAFVRSTGRPFIYFNRVMKFREIAMRGPWTSGGIEYNFGDIGHTPTTATPVDYLTRVNSDGSVSCIVGALDLPSRTEWRVEIRLPKHQALFETRSFWHNPTGTTTSLYHWMNAAVDADSSVQVLYPGTASIGHGGELAPWPIDREGRNLSYYRNNAFGSYKSYHVLGSYTDFFGARKGNAGVVHWSRYTEKPGKKLWIWGLSREGEIWVDLLTDPSLGNIQYIELQSGLHFNQATLQSSRTPFKHMAFLPLSSERFTEAWIPFEGMEGVIRASPDGVLNLRKKNGFLTFEYCPTTSGIEEFTMAVGRRTVYSRTLRLEALQAFRDSVPVQAENVTIEVSIGGKMLYSSLDDSTRNIRRPLREQRPFKWNTAHGLTTEGQERLRQRDIEGALTAFHAALEKDPVYVPAHTGAAELLYGRMEYAGALRHAESALSVDTYDPAANYVYGLIQRQRGRPYDAMDGFGIAARSTTFRPAALYQLAEIALLRGEKKEAEHYAERVLDHDRFNIPALQLLALLHRLAADTSRAMLRHRTILEADPLNHFVRFEMFALKPSDKSRDEFTGMIRNELPYQTYLELASWYFRLNRLSEAAALLACSPRSPMVDIWSAYVSAALGEEHHSRELLARAVTSSPLLVFPHRRESADILRWAAKQSDSWKIQYYLGLLFWSLGRRDSAGVYFERCGNLPDFAPFYLARALFRTNDPRKSLADHRRALEIDPAEWRTANSLATFLNEQGRYSESIPILKNALQRFPESYVLTFAYARTLLCGGEIDAGMAILDTLRILPFEGARYGRDAYRQACVLSALRRMHTKEFDAASGFLARARVWPERLGAGKPYEPDNRLEDFLQSQVMGALGDTAGMQRLLRTIVEYTFRTRETASPQHIFGAIALRRLGRATEGRLFLREWLRREPGNEAARWCVYWYGGERMKARALAESLRKSRLNLYNGDQEFVLVVEVAGDRGLFR